jgi:para-nitrobenzyl esterase
MDRTLVLYVVSGVFLPPKPARPWVGVRDALELGHPSPQLNPDFPVWLDPSDESEDCLVLNVWVPEHARADSSLPVMVWLHGCGFVFGSAGAPFYDGGNLARDGDVIVVGVNHRLNAFGYTYLGDGVDERFALSGNVGHLDLIAALQWVRDNIGAFGGDRGHGPKSSGPIPPDPVTTRNFDLNNEALPAALT